MIKNNGGMGTEDVGSVFQANYVSVSLQVLSEKKNTVRKREGKSNRGVEEI